jgi:TPP-dependent pyruvate/acetoin dehydrogenase alpha subunit
VDPDRVYAQIEEYKQRDPVFSFRDKLFKEGTLTEPAAQKMDEEVRSIVKRAVSEADAAPYPSESSLYEDVHG